MSSQRIIWCPVAWCALFFTAATSYAAGATSASELSRLALAEQRSLFRTILSERMEAFRNAEIVSETWSRNCAYVDGKVGRQVADKGLKAFHLKRNGGSYWLQCGVFLEQKAPSVALELQANFDDTEGASRNLTLVGSRRFGRIDACRDATLNVNRAAYFLAEAQSVSGDVFLNPFLATSDKWTIEITEEANTVSISCPYEYSVLSNENVQGSRYLVLDVTKGMAPIRAGLKWQFDVNKRRWWMQQDAVMSDWETVGELWIPRVYEEVVRSFLLGSSICQVITTTVGRVSLGTVAQGDLSVEFGDGTYVTDAIKGVGYTTGPNGLPATAPTPLFTLASMTDTNDNAFSGYRVWISVAVVCAFVGMVLYQRLLH